jgi:hypothetical protein
MWIRVLEKQTGHGLEHWQQEIARARIRDENAMRAWLGEHGITGYAEQLLLMERFGYPDWVLASADELIDRQYADRPDLRPVYDAILRAVGRFGEVAVQARKGYVSLVARRTFARVVPATRDRVDLGLRLESRKPAGRLKPSRIHETMRLQVSLSSPKDVDAEIVSLLQAAYAENS